MATSLAKLDKASRALSEASSLTDVLEIRDKAEAIRVYVKAASQGLEAQNLAAEIKLRAERKAGEMLAAMEKIGHRPEKGNTMLPFSDQLDDLGISKMQSSRWQLEAKLPEERYCEIVSQCNASGKELTQAAIIRAAKIFTFTEQVGEPSESESCDEFRKVDLLDLIANVRASVRNFADEFGLDRIDILIGVLRDELGVLMELYDGNN